VQAVYTVLRSATRYYRAVTNTHHVHTAHESLKYSINDIRHKTKAHVQSYISERYLKGPPNWAIPD